MKLQQHTNPQACFYQIYSLIIKSCEDHSLLKSYKSYNGGIWKHLQRHYRKISSTVPYSYIWNLVFFLPYSFHWHIPASNLYGTHMGIATGLHIAPIWAAPCKYSKAFVKRPLSKRQKKIGFQDQLSLNAG